MFCPKCGNQLLDTDTFCRYCGAKVGTIAPGANQEPPNMLRPEGQGASPAGGKPGEEQNTAQGNYSVGREAAPTGMKKLRKSLIAIAAAAIIVAIGIGIAATRDTPESYEIGDYVYFGRYEQDNVKSNGKEKIRWKILDKDGDYYLLLSEYVLDAIPFNKDKPDSKWEISTLRTWMNEDFLIRSFAISERQKIRKTFLKNIENPIYGTEAGEDTMDMVFCLSYYEIEEYFPFTYRDELNVFNQDLITEATPYAKDKGVFVFEINENTYIEDSLDEFGYSADCIGTRPAEWWVRTPGITESNVLTCGGGTIGILSPVSYSDDIGVRPALWAKL